MWRFFCTEQIPDNVLARMNYVDVRDTTEAIVRALEKEETAGKRLIVSSGTYARPSRHPMGAHS